MKLTATTIRAYVALAGVALILLSGYVVTFWTSLRFGEHGVQLISGKGSLILQYGNPADHASSTYWQFDYGCLPLADYLCADPYESVFNDLGLIETRMYVPYCESELDGFLSATPTMVRHVRISYWLLLAVTAILAVPSLRRRLALAARFSSHDARIGFAPIVPRQIKRDEQIKRDGSKYRHG